MARKRQGFYQTIEYIGPRPTRPKRPSIFGGWIIIVITAGIAIWFAKPLIPFFQATRHIATTQRAEYLASKLSQSAVTGDRLAAAALTYSTREIQTDYSFDEIPYPNGDVPQHKGMPSDLVIRTFRAIGIDLQKEIHEDISSHFRLYPNLWGASYAKPSVDHRRLPILRRYLSRKALTLPPSQNACDYHFGDIIIWSLNNADLHIGIIVPNPNQSDSNTHCRDKWVVHHPTDQPVKWNDELLEHRIESHFRLP